MTLTALWRSSYNGLVRQILMLGYLWRLSIDLTINFRLLLDERVLGSAFSDAPSTVDIDRSVTFMRYTSNAFFESCAMKIG